jgi:hypothetical protein
MTVTSVRKDPDALTMTVDAEFDASAERVWQLWADPRQRSVGGARRPIPRPSTRTTSRPAAASSPT